MGATAGYRPIKPWAQYPLGYGHGIGAHGPYVGAGSYNPFGVGAVGPAVPAPVPVPGSQHQPQLQQPQPQQQPQQQQPQHEHQPHYLGAGQGQVGMWSHGYGGRGYGGGYGGGYGERYGGRYGGYRGGYGRYGNGIDPALLLLSGGLGGN